jgi:carbonic anhydrase/acetyltransferase-like protein (isoleucine patch superfamily)/bifunctional DNA-binding transcriptional regulator/antitoxin component of YhaV-PrlF toxin-antitoxin module
MDGESFERVIDEVGRIALPGELCDRLGWQVGTRLRLEVDGDSLRLSQSPVASQPAAGPAGAGAGALAAIKEQARQLAESMRGLADTKEVRSILGSLGIQTPDARRQTPDAGDASSRGQEPGARSQEPGAGTVRSFEGHTPQIPETAYVDPAATVIGEVTLGEWCSVWPGAVLRGDAGLLEIGARTNVQDGAVLHAHPEHGPTRVGRGVTIGHGAVVHACTVADHVLIGMHAVVLDGASIGSGSIIGAGAVVPPGTTIPPGQVALGVPARVVRPVTAEEAQTIRWHANSYVELQSRHRGVTPPAGTATALPTYRCRRASGPIHVDGSLDELSWSRAEAIPLLLAGDGEAPRLATEVRLCWDDRCLYAAFSCKDTDIWGTYFQRDEPLYDEEVVELFLSPTGDLRHYFEFEVSPRNTLFDAKVFSPEGDRRSMLVDVEWNAPGIQTAVRVAGTLDNRDDVDLGWIAEIAIPFADLGLAGPPSPGDRWRANFHRIERGEVEEFSAWSPTLKIPADFHVPSRFGTIEFVEE